MRNKYIFLGPLYPREQEKFVREHTRISVSSAANVFQWNLIEGLKCWIEDPLEIINALPVGTWPRAYGKAVLHDNDWISAGIIGNEVGCINLPFVKQHMRYRTARRLLEKKAEAGAEVIVYSAYMPFLKATSYLPPSVKVTAIITDLPEYYDLDQVSFVHKQLRKLQNKMIYRYLSRVDRFVLLTDQMAGPLQVGERPWMRMEGICQIQVPEEPLTVTNARGILYSGTLHYQYGIKNLLDAFEAMEDPLLELWICGGGEAEKEIIELSKRDSRVKFFGFCDQKVVADLRQRAAVLVNPRTNQGEYTKYSFPSKTMEYMASGKPVVMYKLDGVPDEYDPYLFYAEEDENVVRSLKSALTQVLEHYDNAQQRAEKAKRFVVQQKNATRQAQRILRFIEENV